MTARIATREVAPGEEVDRSEVDEGEGDEQGSIDRDDSLRTKVPESPDEVELSSSRGAPCLRARRRPLLDQPEVTITIHPAVLLEQHPELRARRMRCARRERL